MPEKEELANLLEKLFMPVVKVIKRSHYIDIIDLNTAICPSVKRNSKTLKSLLPSRVPNLQNAQCKLIEKLN